MATIHINRATLEYRDNGSGASVVLVHGSTSDLRTWERQQAEFSEQYRAISYSRRYHWPNDRIPPGADYSMVEHVHDLELVIRELSAAPAHLVGHSYGGFVCLLLAIRRPELVRTLVLAEPPVLSLFVSIPPRPAEVLKLLVKRPRTAVALIRFAALGFGPAASAAQRDDMESAMRHFGTAVLGRDVFRRLSESRLDQVRANLIKAEFLGSGLAPLNDDDIRRIGMPVLLLGGQRSPRLFHRLSDRLHELLPLANRVEVPNASHIMHEDNPDAFRAAVVAFLREVPNESTGRQA